MRCSCGAEHELLDPTFRRPDAIAALTGDERAHRARESDDICGLRIDDGPPRCYLRCVLPVALVDAPPDAERATIQWGLWVEIDSEALARVQELWSDPDQAREPSFAGRLANQIPGHEGAIGLPLTVALTGPDTRPRLTFGTQSDHPFARECQDGVTLHRAGEWVASMGRPRHTPAFVCLHVLDEGAPIRLVVHDHEGDWQLLCGGDNHDDARLAGLSHFVEQDRSLREVLDLELGQEAERAEVGGPWSRRTVLDED